MKLKKIIQRGQVMVLYALLIPLLFLFVGVGLDLGWYYLNVSRLQNAADAAVLAGAWKLVERDATLKEYYVAYLTDGKPSDFNAKNYDAYVLSDSGGYVKREVGQAKAEKEAKLYANQNLTDAALEHSDIEKRKNVINEWNVSQNKHKTKKNVQFTATLYSKQADYQLETRSQKSANGIKYYEVQLQEQIGHLFFQGDMFKPMNAKVVAYAMLKPRENDLNTAASKLKDEHTIENWEYQNKFHNYTENWNHYRQTIGGGKKIAYKTGDDFRTETVNITTQIGDKSNNTNTSAGQTTSANGNKFYGELEVDAINIDFNQDFIVSKAVTKDWDIRQSTTVDGATVGYIGMSGWNENHGYDLRIQGLINFNDVWRNRNLLDSDTTNNLKADPLWARIESDPMWSKGVAWGEQKTLNSVHQMIVTINQDNTEAVDVDSSGNRIVDSKGKECKAYKYRPVFLVYMGPESNEVNSTLRQSQPLVLNLNANFNGIIYAPNSPVVINGNGHKFMGFVIAKEYRFLTTDDDYTSNGYIATNDAYGHTIFVKEENLLTEDKIYEKYPLKNYNSVPNTNGDIYVYEKTVAPEHVILSIDKTEAQQYDNFAAYINATYKEKFMAATGLTESEISTVTLPQVDNNGEEAYTVATSDLSSTQKTGYVKVMKGTEEWYIDKNKLPYVKIRDNKNRPYVSVYDLKKKKAGDYNNNTYTSVKITDDSIAATGSNTNADLWSNNDERSIVADLLSNTYNKSYIDSKIKIVERDNQKYFFFNSDLEKKNVAEYRKVIQTEENGDETVLYIKEATTEEYNENGASYYMKVTKSANTDLSNNPIIIDNKGDLQTKPLTPPEVFTAVTKSENDSLISKAEWTGIFALASTANLRAYWNTYTRYPNGAPPRADERPIEIPRDEGLIEKGRYIGKTNAHKNEDYRIPALERIYLKSTFNLREDSYYSYFNIPELKRVNYTYLNVDELNGNPESNLIEDMFFTTRRASWID